MHGLYLIAIVAGREIAIDAQAVEAVVKVGEVINVPKVDPIVAGLYALRSRVLTLIDCQFCITGRSAPLETLCLAVIASIGKNQFGFLVEQVVDVISAEGADLQPLPPAASKWNEFAIGHADIGDRPVLVVDLERLVSRDAVQRAA